MLKFGSIRQHNIKGQRRMRAVIEAIYFCQLMQDDRLFCADLSCVLTRTGVTKATGRITTATTVPDCPWEIMTMEFITSIPLSDGFGTIMVLVDGF